MLKLIVLPLIVYVVIVVVPPENGNDVVAPFVMFLGLVPLAIGLLRSTTYIIHHCPVKSLF